MKKGVNNNVISVVNNAEIRTNCQGLMCPSRGTENIELKLNDDRIIKILACSECASKLR